MPLLRFIGVRAGVTARIRNQHIGCDEGPPHDSEGDFGNDCPIQDILMNDGGVWFYDFRNEQEPEKKRQQEKHPQNQEGSSRSRRTKREVRYLRIHGHNHRETKWVQTLNKNRKGEMKQVRG